MARIKLTLTIEEEFLKRYKDFCKKEGINISRRVENFMNNDMIKNGDK
ncbi:MAG: DUF6364 family protein [Nanoarchaeota archaeon]|mgnify:CR=1 FL=1